MIEVTLNFTFYKRRKFVNNLVPYVFLLTRNLVVLSQSHVCIVMHFTLIELSRNSSLLIDNPSKKGDVETWARYSVSPSPQVRNEALFDCL